MKTFIVLLPKIDWDLVAVTRFVQGKKLKTINNLTTLINKASGGDFEYLPVEEFNKVINTKPINLDPFWVTSVEIEDATPPQMTREKAKVIISNALDSYCNNEQSELKDIKEIRKAWEVYK